MIGPWLYSGRAHSSARPVSPNQNSGSVETIATANQAMPAGLTARSGVGRRPSACIDVLMPLPVPVPRPSGTHPGPGGAS
jgi:hypothetical protein